GKWRGHSIEKSELESQIEREQSQDAHNEAVEREPPVDIGESVTTGVTEFRSHHSGREQAVCKVEGFVIFVEGCPPGTEVGDRITAKITSFGANRTSAEAVYQG
ncbi:MAG: putative RNA-binding protein with TRAM domain, partial [Natronomonas sp.]